MYSFNVPTFNEIVSEEDFVTYLSVFVEWNYSITRKFGRSCTKSLSFYSSDSSVDRSSHMYVSLRRKDYRSGSSWHTNLPG